MKVAVSDSFFGHFFEKIGQQGQRFLFLLILIIGFWFSLLSVVMALCFALLLRFFSVRVLSVIAFFGLCLMLEAWGLSHITFRLVHLQSNFLYRTLFQGSMNLNIPYFSLSATPYALFMGCAMALSMRMSSHLQQELKRVESGLLSPRYAFMRPKRINSALKPIQSSAVSGGAVLGVNRENAQHVILNDQSANLHTLAIGTTGSGKTTGVANIVESAIVRNHPVFYVDGKGDLTLANAIKCFAERHRIPFYLFSMKGASLKYNPIALGGYTSKKDRLIELRTWSEDHYRKLAEGYLQTVFKLLDQREVLVDLHSLSGYLEPEALYGLARQYKDKAMMDKVSSLEAAYSQMSSLIGEIRNITESEIGHLFDTLVGEVINLAHVLEEGGVVYFCLQPLAFPAYAETLGKLIINDIKSLLATQLERRNPKKLFAFFDEFSIFAGDQIVNLINQGRGAGMHAVLATQSLSDIQCKGGDALLGQVLNNTNNYIIQRQNYPEDAEILANIIGTERAFEVTSQLTTAHTAARMGTVRQTREFIVHPDEVKRLALGQAIFVNKQPFQVQHIHLRKGKI